MCVYGLPSSSGPDTEIYVFIPNCVRVCLSLSGFLNVCDCVRVWESAHLGNKGTVHDVLSEGSKYSDAHGS